MVRTNEHYNVFTGSNCLLISICLSLCLSICLPTVGTEAVIQFTPNREILALLEEVLCVRLEGMLEQCTQEAMRNWYGLLDREIYSIPPCMLISPYVYMFSIWRLYVRLPWFLFYPVISVPMGRIETKQLFVYISKRILSVWLKHYVSILRSVILPDHECRDEKFHFIIPTFSPKEGTTLREIEIENDLLQATSHLSRVWDAEVQLN